MHSYVRQPSGCFIFKTRGFSCALGGDEFSVILYDTNKTNANNVAQKKLHLLSQAFHFGESQRNVTASLGIALYPQPG
jgi:GGDEF domain-containing protein